MRRTALVSMLAASLLSAAAARADDVSDALSEARSAYDGGDLAKTKQALDLAGQLVAQKQSDALAKLLPEPPAGWTAEAAESGAAGVAAILGGGITVERKYQKDDKTVSVSMMANSPILGAMVPMFSNVQMLGAMGKVFRQQGRVAVLSDEREIQMVLGKTFLTISGSATEADKRAILDLFDLAAIEAFAK